MGNIVKMGKKENGGILRTQSVGSAAAGAKCGNKIDWTRRIPAAEWWNRGGGRGETESPADAERGCCGGRKSCCGGRESCWGGKMPRTGAVSFRVG